MSFSINYPVGPREAVAKAVRDGDHHAKGQHTQLDQAREFIAETVEHIPGVGVPVALTISGHHSDTTRSISISVQVVAEFNLDIDAYPNAPQTPVEAAETPAEA